MEGEEEESVTEGRGKVGEETEGSTSSVLESLSSLLSLITLGQNIKDRP